MPAMPNKCYSGCHKATEEENDQETLGKEIWSEKCGQWASASAASRCRWQHRTGGVVAYDTLGVTTIYVKYVPECT